MKKILIFLLFTFVVFAKNTKDLMLPLVAKDNIPSGSLVFIDKDEEVIYNWGEAIPGRNFSQYSYIHSGSISKIFTSLALIKLSNEGLLDLNEYVYKYTGSIIKNPLFNEIKVKDILTHTSGLEHKSIETAIDDLSKYRDLENSLKKSLNFHTKPGELIIYSSPSMAIAGLIIEGITNLTFEEYMDKLFDEYKIKGTYNASEFEKLKFAQGHDKGGRVYDKKYYTLLRPSGDLAIRPMDMYKFIQASFEDDNIKEMFPTRFQTDKNLAGRTYGFSEGYYKGQRYIFHDGGAPGYNSRLVLIPELKTGFFLTYTSDKTSFKDTLTKSLFEEIFGDIKPLYEEGIKKQVEVYEGLYYSLDTYTNNIEKFSNLMGQVTLKASENGFYFGKKNYIDTGLGYFVDEEGRRANFSTIDEDIYLNIDRTSYKLASGLEKRDIELGLILILVIAIVTSFFYSFVSYINQNMKKSLYLFLTSSLYLFNLVAFAFYLLKVNIWNLAYVEFNFLDILKIINYISILPFLLYLSSRRDQRFSPRFYTGKVLFTLVIVAYFAFLIRYNIL